MLEEMASTRQGVGYLTLHYTGHGHGTPYASRPHIRIQDVTSLETWCNDILDVLSDARELLRSEDSEEDNDGQKVIFVGASLGGWLALILATLHREGSIIFSQNIAGAVLVAPAIDASVRWEKLIAEQKTPNTTVAVPSAYLEMGSHILLHKDLIIEANKRFLLLEPSSTANLKERGLCFPIRILYGTRDEVIDVDKLQLARSYHWSTTVECIQGGDHRLSDEYSLARIRQAVEGLM